MAGSLASKREMGESIVFVVVILKGKKRWNGEDDFETTTENAKMRE